MNEEQIEEKKHAMQRAEEDPIDFIIEQLESLRYSYSEDEKTYGAALDRAVEMVSNLNTRHWRGWDRFT